MTGALVRSHPVAIAVSVTLLSAGGAVACHLRAGELRREAGWLLERAHAEAAEYVATLDSSLAESQLKAFEERRQILDRAYLWQRGQMLLVLLGVVSGFSSYALSLRHRLRADSAPRSNAATEAARR
jgi:hypothetical protein